MIAVKEEKKVKKNVTQLEISIFLLDLSNVITGNIGIHKVYVIFRFLSGLNEVVGRG